MNPIRDELDHPCTCKELIKAEMRVEILEYLCDLNLIPLEEVEQAQARLVSMSSNGHLTNQTTLQQCRDAISECRGEIRIIKSDMTFVLQRTLQIINSFSILHNRLAGASSWVSVLFPSGQDPTQEPHNLPPIRGIQDLLELSTEQLTAYLTGYGATSIPPSVEDGRRLLAQYLGVRIE